MSRYSPILLKLSDKVLLNFFILPIFSAGWEAGIRSHIFSSTSTPTLAEGPAADGLCVGSGERRTGVPSALRGLLQSSCSALANRKRSLSRLSLLSSTSAANVSLRIALKKKNYISKDKSEAGACKPEIVRKLLRLSCCAPILLSAWNSASALTSFFLLSASQLLLAPPQSRCHFWDSLSGFDPQTPPWMRG